MSKLSKEIIQEFIKRKHFKSEQAAANFISKIKINEGLDCTQNAVAQIAAKIKGFSIAKRLKKEDKIPNNFSEIVDKYTNKTKVNYKKQIIIKKVGKENPYDFPLTKFKLNSGLTEDCAPIFKKPFRGAIKEALLNLEDHIRSKINSEEDGKNLITEARNKGVFKRKKSSESEGLFFLYSGTIAWLRNPPNHRKLKYGKEEAIKIILFADYLIELFNQLCLENRI